MNCRVTDSQEMPLAADSFRPTFSGVRNKRKVRMRQYMRPIGLPFVGGFSAALAGGRLSSRLGLWLALGLGSLASKRVPSE